MVMAKYELNVAAVNEWRAKNEPMAKQKLALAARCSDRTVHKLFNGVAPQTAGLRWRVAQALGIAESELFPFTLKKLRA